MDLSLRAVRVSDNLDPALDALPVEQAGGLLDLVGEKVEGLRRDRARFCLKRKRPGNIRAAAKLVLWVFQGITCYIAPFA